MKVIYRQSRASAYTRGEVLNFFRVGSSWLGSSNNSIILLRQIQIDLENIVIHTCLRLSSIDQIV